MLSLSASFFVLGSDLNPFHFLGARSIPEALFSPLLGLCLRTIVGAFLILYPQSCLLLRLQHRTAFLMLQISMLFSLLWLKRITTGSSVEVGKGRKGEEDACYEAYKGDSNNHFDVHSFSPPFFF